MGIHIFGVTFPQNFDYPLEIYINRYGDVESYSADGKQLGVAIEVKEHGRLVDADRMMIEEKVAFNTAQAILPVNDMITKTINDSVHKKIEMLINDTPTVIPEDRGKK